MKNKVIVIGLDGATFDIIDPLIARGKLPNLNTIFQNGVKAELLSTIPPISAPAWVSFMTGKNPGKHGILGFQYYNLSKYNCVEHSIVNSNVFAQSTIFDILTKYNRKSIAFQVPLTYPTWPINGLMVAGYPTPDQTIAYTYPDDLSKKIGKLYEDKSDHIASGSIETKLNIYSEGLERISNTVEKLLKEEDYELFVYVTNVTDWVQHKFWKHQFNGKNSKNDYINQFYIKIDEKIGNILKLIDKDTTLIVMSDHGAGTRPEKLLNINYLLREQGFLVPTAKKINIFTKTNRYWFEWVKEFFPIKYWSKAKFSSSFREMVLNTRVYKNNIDWSKTKAYRVPLSYPYVGLNINVKSRQKDGIVLPGKEYKELKQQLYKNFKGFSDKNPDLIKNVFLQEEVYNGPSSYNTPDIIIELNENYDSGSEVDELITEIPNMLLTTISGYHRTSGIFGAMGKNINHNPQLFKFNIIDIAPTILYTLNLP
ncbi:MAG: alkaline phosphatase family protein, partial [Cyanobacteriota bacterium]